MGKKNQALESARRRVLTFLEEQPDVQDVGAFYKHDDEESYFLEVAIPDSCAWDVLLQLEPLLQEIGLANDFTIVAIPVPTLSTKASVTS